MLDVESKDIEELIPRHYLRSLPAALPELSESEVVRHFVRLSTMNHHIDKGFYPLGSCTMKYNPKVNELTAALPGMREIHPLQPEEMSQGVLRLMYELAECLKEYPECRQSVCSQPPGHKGS